MTNKALITEQALALRDTIRLLRAEIGKMMCAARVATCNCGSEIELTLPQLHCLTRIRELGQTSIKEIAAELSVSPPSASTMVDRLVEMGALSREPSPLDRRGVVIKTTCRGNQTLDAMEAVMLRGLEQLLEQIGEDCSRKWCEVYGTIHKVLNEKPDILVQNMKRENTPQCK